MTEFTKANWQPTRNDVQSWGYDEDAWLTDQDEDIVFYAPQYIPMLLEFALDPDCPKHEVALQYLYLYAQDTFEHRRQRNEHEIIAFLDGAKSVQNTAHRGVQQWTESVLQQIDILSVNSRFVTEFGKG